MGYTALGNAQWTAWSPTFTGYVSPPDGTITARYILIGKMCHVYIRMVGETINSNATTLTVTLPFAAANTGVQINLITLVVNAGATTNTPGAIHTIVNSNIANCYINTALGAWTNSATTKAINCSFTYETT